MTRPARMFQISRVGSGRVNRLQNPTGRVGSRDFKEQWPKSGTPDRPIAVIGYPFNTVAQRLRTTSHWSKPHRIRRQPHVHRVHPIMAEQVLEMYPTRIQATRLWPDYSTTHMHKRTRSGRELAPRHEAGHFLFFRLGALCCGL